MTHATTQMNFEDIRLKSASQKTTNTVRFRLYEVPRGARFLRQEADGGARGWGGMGSHCLMGTECQLGKMRKVPWLAGGDGCTAM